MTCKVGIFVPVYYREHLVEDCLNSLARCFYFDIEPHLIIGLGGARQSFCDQFIKNYKDTYNNNVFATVNVLDTTDFTSKLNCLRYISKKSDEFDVYIWIDSDLYIEDRYLICKSVDIMTKLGHGYCISPREIGFSKHKYAEYSPIYQNIHTVNVIHTPNNEGISTSMCIFNKSSYENLQILPNISINRLLLMQNIKLVSTDELVVYHPINNSTLYQDWIEMVNSKNGNN